MTTLRFKGSGVQRIVRHMTEATDWSQGWAERVADKHKTAKPRPQLVFVHDDGLYIMSNGKPNLMAGPKNFVVYATGYDPRTPGVWDKARDAVGGDDFVEHLDLGPAMTEAILSRRFLSLDITVSENALEIVVQQRGAVMHKYAEYAGTAARTEAARQKPFGAGVVDSAIERVEVWATDWSDPGQDYCEFRCFDRDGKRIGTYRLAGY